MYSFVNIPRNAGTSVEVLFKKNYSEKIQGIGTINACKDYKHPIIIIRNPIDRFISICNFFISYKGLEMKEKKINCKNINDFLDLKMRKDVNLEKLLNKTENRKYYSKQTNWIREKEYNKTIVVVYDKNLEIRINDLLKYLNIEIKDVSLKNINKIQNKKKFIFKKEQLEWLKNEFKSDFLLWDLVNNNESKFRKVIK